MDLRSRRWRYVGITLDRIRNEKTTIVYEMVGPAFNAQDWALCFPPQAAIETRIPSAGRSPWRMIFNYSIHGPLPLVFCCYWH